MVDFDLIGGFSKRTKLEGCFVLDSSIQGKNLSSRILNGAYIVDSFERGNIKVLKK